MSNLTVMPLPDAKELDSIQGVTQDRFSKQDSLILALGIVVGIIFEFGILYGSWVGFNQLGLASPVMVCLMTIEAVVGLAVSILVTAIVLRILRHRNENQTEEDHNLSDAKFLIEASQMEIELQNDNILHIRDENIKTVTSFCNHMFQFSDVRISNILTQVCIAETSKLKKTILEENDQLDRIGINRFTYKKLSRFQGEAPELVEFIEFKLRTQLQCAEIVCELLDNHIDPDIMVRGLTWLFFTSRPVPWDKIDLSQDIQSIETSNTQSQVLIDTIKQEDLNDFKRKMVSIINENAFQVLKEKANAFIQKINDPNLLSFLKPNLIVIEQSLKEEFQGNIIAANGEMLFEAYTRLVEAKIELYNTRIEFDKDFPI